MKVLCGGQAVILGLENINLDDFPRLRVIGCNMTGTDHLPTEEIEKRGIKLISLKGETEFLRDIPSVAELTIWFIFELIRRPHEGRFLGSQLKGKTVGIVGMGRIGTHIAERVVPFGVEILHNDIRDERYYYLGGMDNFRTLPKIFAESDIVSINVPLNESTSGMITEEHLGIMKKSAVLINTSRGQVIQEGAVEKAIGKGWLAGYGTDVVRDDSEMGRLKQLGMEGFNVVTTEHIGGNTREAVEATEAFIIQKVQKYVEENL